MMEQIGKTYRNTEDTEAEENTVNKIGIQTDVENMVVMLAVGVMTKIIKIMI